MATISSKVAVVKGEGDLPERFICPVCSRLPEKEVFQCRDGHVLCSECYNKKTKCPQCAGSLVKHQPIRNRFFEAGLEQFAKVDCSFKSNGCAEKVRKDLLEQHQHSCYFNFEKFGSPFSLCKAMNLSCNFHFNQSNLKEFVDHFIFVHGAKITKSMEFRMELCNFLGGSSSSSVVGRNSAVSDSEEHGYALEFFTPIVTNLEEEEAYILTIPMLNTSLDLFQIVSYYLPCFNSEKALVNPFKMEYSVSRAAGAEYTGSAWSFVAVLIDAPINIKEAKKAGFTTTRSRCLQTSHLKSYITAGNCLLVYCKTLIGENAIKNESNVTPPLRVLKCRNISKMNIEPKTLKRWNSRKEALCPAAKDYFKSFQDANRTHYRPGDQKKVLEIIDTIIESVVYNEEGYLLARFGRDKFEYIMYAVMFDVVDYGSVEALKRMMGINGNGLDWGVISEFGATLLHRAMSDYDLERGLEKVQLLLDKIDIIDIDIKAFDDHGNSLAHHAALWSNAKGLTLVCQLDLDLNAKNKAGNTPSHLAMLNYTGMYTSVEKVEVLLNHGAKLNVRNEEGNKPLDVAADGEDWYFWMKVEEYVKDYYISKRIAGKLKQ